MLLKCCLNVAENVTKNVAKMFVFRVIGMIGLPIGTQRVQVLLDMLVPTDGQQVSTHVRFTVKDGEVCPVFVTDEQNWHTSAASFVIGFKRMMAVAGTNTDLGNMSHLLGEGVEIVMSDGDLGAKNLWQIRVTLTGAPPKLFWPETLGAAFNRQVIKPALVTRGGRCREVIVTRPSRVSVRYIPCVVKMVFSEEGLGLNREQTKCASAATTRFFVFIEAHGRVY
jgi:hypothetical protein